MAFERGKSGNPDGRPPGPNKLTMAARQRIAEDCDPIGFLASVMKGEPQVIGEGEAQVTHQPTLADRTGAARSLLGKMVPDAKDRPLAFEVGEITGPSDALSCMGRVIAAMGTGELTALEAKSVMDVVGIYLEAWKANDMEQRLQALEAKA